MAARIKYEGPPRGKYARDVEFAFQQPIARAVTAAFREAAKEIERDGRQQIREAGLGPRFERGFRVFSFPRRQASLDPAIKGTHRFGYANIYERGGTIRGKPLLWLPLPTAPAKIDGKRTTPRVFVDRIGPLVRINRPGKPPLLAGQATRGVTAGRRATVGALRTGAKNARARRAGGRARRVVLVPLFVGVRVAQIRRRLNISALYERARARLPALYFKHFNQETR